MNFISKYDDKFEATFRQNDLLDTKVLVETLYHSGKSKIFLQCSRVNAFSHLILKS